MFGPSPCIANMNRCSIPRQHGGPAARFTRPRSRRPGERWCRGAPHLQGMLWASLVAALALGQPNLSPPEPEQRSVDALALPTPSFNSDLGFGLGVVGGAYWYARGY